MKRRRPQLPCHEEDRPLSNSSRRRSKSLFRSARVWFQRPIAKIVATIVSSALLVSLIRLQRPSRSLGSGISRMVSFGLFQSRTPPSPAFDEGDDAVPASSSLQEIRLRAALWGLFAGDALASPTHWYYGGLAQIQRDYGRSGIVDYTKPVWNLPGSILNKSNLNGGGRSSAHANNNGRTGGMPPSIIGYVINRGKQDLWSPSKQIHYHATLQAGENTLEAQLVRVLMKSMVATGGRFDPDHFRRAYMDYMMADPDRGGVSHNDTYASTCHRMFFANLVYRKLPPKDCPDNDKHNVDTMDGLVLPTVASLATAIATENRAEASEAAAACAAVTRKSQVLEGAAAAWSDLLYNLVTAKSPNVKDSAQHVSKQLRLRGSPTGRGNDQMTACYLADSLPSLLNGVVKYGNGNGDDSSSTAPAASLDGVWNALLANANLGGENVHRGACLGAALGAAAPAFESRQFVDPKQRIIRGLYDFESLNREIDSFVAAVVKKNKNDEEEVDS